jgi:hypothetical protein
MKGEQRPMTRDELIKRFNDLMEANWKVKNMYNSSSFSSEIDAIDNWFSGTRTILLNRLGIEESRKAGIYYEVEKR